MRVLNQLDRRAHRLGFVDVKLFSVSALFAGFWVAKVFPEVLSLSAWWYVALCAALAVHPLIVLLGLSGRRATTEAS